MILIRFSVTFLQLRLSPFVSFFAYVVDLLVFPLLFPEASLFKEKNKKESNRVHRVRICVTFGHTKGARKAVRWCIYLFYQKFEGRKKQEVKKERSYKSSVIH